MASIRKAKKQAKKEGKVFNMQPIKEKRQLEKTVDKNIRETNRRLRALDRNGYYNSFSSKKLFERLSGKVNALDKIGDKVIGIKRTKKMNITDLTYINKATRNFLRSATSTPKRLRGVVEETKRSMLRTLKTEDNTITMDDIENYYNMLGSGDFDFFNDKYGNSANYIGASELWSLIDDAKEMDVDQKGFLSMLSKYAVNVKDKEVRQKAINLFNKYV